MKRIEDKKGKNNIWMIASVTLCVAPICLYIGFLWGINSVEMEIIPRLTSFRKIVGLSGFLLFGLGFIWLIYDSILSFPDDWNLTKLRAYDVQYNHQSTWWKQQEFGGFIFGKLCQLLFIVLLGLLSVACAVYTFLPTN
ncbi:hypothetical protein [Vibrio fluvialis]|uniref:hypothetical protein n=1 Tax=Vibrio fluvialis TaxID=676 RepID=UPI0023A9878C|nr:hypothetical protein [Vibrio fluvialis]MDE5179114.1 hypothetical protein [Vibrio fluvialis]